MQEDRFIYLLDQYKKGALSEEQRRELLDATASGNETELLAIMEQLAEKDSLLAETLPSPAQEAALAKVVAIDKTIKPVEEDNYTRIPRTLHYLQKTRWWAAAAVLIIGFGGYLYFTGRQNKPVVNNETPITYDVKAPGTNRAMITLANGEKVYLDSVADGDLALEGNIKLVKLSNGEVAYQTVPGTGSKEIQYNTLTNPRGSNVINITLADGSRVWLNAGSSFKYPVSFTGKEREVAITGEAYFEIAHQAAMPFKVKKGDVVITVLGTHFNINAYDDEGAIKVTLLEGAVKIAKGVAYCLLKPGQQAQVSSAVNIVDGIDEDQVMAWKNGYFSFKQTDLTEVMRQIARWYDVDIVYEGKIPGRKFRGEIPRNSNASQVLKILEESKVHFRIEDKRIVVMP